MLHIALALLYDVILAIVCSAALLWGGRPEKIGAVINLVASIATTALQLSDAAYFAPAALPIIIIDAIVACCFCWLSVTTIRFWPLWACGFSVTNLYTELFGALRPHVPLFAYQTGLGTYAYLTLGALALATYRLPRDAAAYLRNGSRQSWVQHLKETS
jgi:hypothetical protein